MEKSVKFFNFSFVLLKETFPRNEKFQNNFVCPCLSFIYTYLLYIRHFHIKNSMSLCTILLGIDEEVDDVYFDVHFYKTERVYCKMMME